MRYPTTRRLWLTLGTGLVIWCVLLGVGVAADLHVVHALSVHAAGR